MRIQGWLNCSSNKTSPSGQNGGAELTIAGVRSSQSRQALLQGQDSHRRTAVAYNKLNRGTVPPLGSMPRRSIIAETQITRCLVASDNTAASLCLPGKSNARD